MTAIDLFAGIGGWTLGAARTGVRVLWAANHWPDACRWHQANHPDVQHDCQDLRQANFNEVPDHDILLGSPSCQGHSRARGVDRPQHDTARATAWAIVDCAEAKRPRFMIVENVPEFVSWTLYPAWSSALQLLGYSLSIHVLDAADFGVPQHRRRVFIIGSRSANPLKLGFTPAKHVPAADILEDAPATTSVRSLCRSTRDRVRRGRQTYGDRFLMPYYGSGSGLTGRSLDRPIGTITTRERWAYVCGDRMRMLTLGENRRAMSFPDDYRMPENKRLAVHLLGNAVPPVQACGILTELKRAA